MTLISSPAPLTSLYPYPCIHSQPQEHSYSLPLNPGLSWLQQPAAAPESASAQASPQKYRTLASIHLHSRSHQYHHSINSNSLDNTNSNTNNTTTIAPLSPSIKPTSQDNLPITHTPVSSVITLEKQAFAGLLKSASSITSAIQEMDNSHGTCFLPWIHNPANLDYISLRLRPLCLEYPLVNVANVLRWIGADWSSTDCKALFRAVTQSWDQGKRRMLAFLLIRDEDMRQRAKSKLVEFAQKSGGRGSRTHSHKTSQQQQQNRCVQNQPQQQEQQQQQQQQPYLRRLQSTADDASEGTVGPVEVVEGIPASFAATPTTPTGLSLLEDIVAAAMITGMDISESFILPSIRASTITTAGSIRQHRHAPY
ncbi:hypothetical protein EDD11_005833 [Mortierella claussenii]|nr:hypothetical protein EDD11_005833 [Mortierella claussenii]